MSEPSTLAAAARVCPVAKLAQDVTTLLHALTHLAASREEEDGASPAYVAELVRQRIHACEALALSLRATSKVGAAFQLLLAEDLMDEAYGLRSAGRHDEEARWRTLYLKSLTAFSSVRAVLLETAPLPARLLTEYSNPKLDAQALINDQIAEAEAHATIT